MVTLVEVYAHFLFRSRFIIRIRIIRLITKIFLKKVCIIYL